MTKITKTYSVDNKIYEAFEKIADEKNINKSSFIESCINKYIDDNHARNKKVYILKTDPTYGVSISREDDTFYYLNDGSKIPIILFMQMYKEVEQVKPEEFFKNPLKDSIKIKDNNFSKTGFDGYEKINS